jgi:hypothetical protein
MASYLTFSSCTVVRCEKLLHPFQYQRRHNPDHHGTIRDHQKTAIVISFPVAAFPVGKAIYNLEDRSA